MRAKKKFGQNFLCDNNVITNIIHSFNIQIADNIVEIGPGHGAITSKLIEKIAQNKIIYLIEIDRDLAKILTDKYTTNIQLFNEDILKFNLNTIVEHIINNNQHNKNNKIKIIGNLPYNISTPILFHLFKYLNNIESMLFMLQEEVVDRIIAKPNTKQYGRLSVMTQLFCTTEKLFTIPPNAFKPAPKVNSAMVQMIPRIDNKYLGVDLATIDFKLFNNIVTAAFNQRRKTLSNSLKQYIDSDALRNLNIDPTARAENVSILEYLNIALLKINSPNR